MVKKNHLPAKKPRGKIYLIPAVVSGFLMISFAFNSLFFSYIIFTSSTSSIFVLSLAASIILFLIFYVAYATTKQKFLTRDSAQHTKPKKKHGFPLVTLLKTHGAVLIIVGIAASALLWQAVEPRFNERPLSNAKPTTNVQVAWEEFIKRNGSATYYDATPFFEGHYSQACFKDSVIPKGKTCIFSNTEFYTLPGEYTENVKKVLTYLLSHGYAFHKNEGIQRGLEYYSDPAYLKGEMEHGFILISLRNTSDTNNHISLSVNKKAGLENSVFYKIPQSTIDNIPDKSTIYRLMESTTIR